MPQIFLKGATFSIFGKIGQQDSLAFGKGTFDDAGHFERQLTVASRLDSVLIYTNYIGLIDNVRLAVEGPDLVFDYRQFYQRSGSSNIRLERPRPILPQSNVQVDYTFIDTFNFLGVPDNLAFSDVIEQNLLDDINASLPENVPGGIPVSNPDFLAGKETSLIITEEGRCVGSLLFPKVLDSAMFWVIIPIHLVTSHRAWTTLQNTMLFFQMYPSWDREGVLIPGDRVYLGRFPENTVISWFFGGQWLVW